MNKVDPSADTKPSDEMAFKTLANLLHPTQLPRFTSKPVSFTTNILIIGGSYAGLATLRSLQQSISPYHHHADRKISVTLVEPRNGLLNILGIPKSIVDPAFAATQYIPFNKLNHVRFTSIVSAEASEFDESWYASAEAIDVNFVHGKITYLDRQQAKYQISADAKQEKEEEEGEIRFDYVVLASGRDRNWPTTPASATLQQYLAEMSKAHQMIKQAAVVSVIGAGAVGIEIAGDVKSAYPEKTVNLIHPHGEFPPEPLTAEFKHMIQDSIERAGINIYLNTRIHQHNSGDSAEEAGNDDDNGGDLVTMHTNKRISSNVNFWCCAKFNNIQFLSRQLAAYITPTNQIRVNSYLQLNHKGDDDDASSSTVANFFVVGDLVDFEIIKSAGWAMYMGRQTANNITGLIFSGSCVEKMPELSTMPRGMVLVGGSNEIVSELAGEVELNHEGYVREYVDYCIGKVRATLDV
ncbi:uncharacterized protein LODBEIA_P51240 [Lodderomyces beijingensis]|uniref:FAD/NAD(P)-binding domain-containing protein n=1 Tax=Lodderomyces beijingensis TaxID=1775926 RepID=A0ABP0ZRX2_9ASCO